MKTFRPLLIIVLLLHGHLVVAEQATESEISQPPIEDLGDDQYRIGNILVDRPARRFSMPGRVLHLEEPLEYLAVTVGGRKAYESLLELETTGRAFKLASILIGLDEEQARRARYQLDRREIIGTPVELWLSWTEGGELRAARAETAILNGDRPFDDSSWVYTGSLTRKSDGALAADLFGSIISFVHDPVAIIDHRVGAGIGAYGSITGNADLLPPEGAPVTLSVVAINETGGEEQTTEGD